MSLGEATFPRKDAARLLQCAGMHATERPNGYYYTKERHLVPKCNPAPLSHNFFTSGNWALSPWSSFRKMRFESVVVGCALTNDRMAATERCAGSTFCVNHLTQGCGALFDSIDQPVHHQPGSNFRALGHVEQPYLLSDAAFGNNLPTI